MSPKTPIYRQRLTSLGWIGASLFVLCPVVMALTAREALLAGYLYGSPDIAPVVVAGIGWLVAPILLLVGREHYPFTALVEE